MTAPMTSLENDLDHLTALLDGAWPSGHKAMAASIIAAGYSRLCAPAQTARLDPADLWGRYLAETDNPSPQGAMAFALAAIGPDDDWEERGAADELRRATIEECARIAAAAEGPPPEITPGTMAKWIAASIRALSSEQGTGE